jgi:hypothetical protein
MYRHRFPAVEPIAVVAQPLTDGAQIDPRFQQMHRRAIPHTMGMEVFPFQAGHGRLRAFEVFGQDVAHPKTAHRLPALIHEDGHSGPQVKPPLGTELAEQGRCLGPQRAQALFAPLAEEPYLGKRSQGVKFTSH